MDCYKKFAHIYDELIKSDVDYSTWAENIVKICKDKNINFEDYLDLACGTGNLTYNLAHNFSHVWGVDMSDDMLSEADAKLREKNIRARLINQNICELNLNKKFDLITCCLDSTNYILEEKNLEQYFKRVKEHLKDNGIFIFDINSHYKLSSILGNNIFTYDNDDDVVYIWQNEFENEIVDMYLTFFVKADDGKYERFDEEHTERAYTEEYIEGLLKKYNFNVLKKLNNYTEDVVDEKTERIVYVVN